MQFQQLGALGRIGDVEADLESEVLALQEVHQAAQVRGGAVVRGCDQQQFEQPPLRRLRRGAQGRARTSLLQPDLTCLRHGAAAGLRTGLLFGGAWFPSGMHRRGGSW